MQSLRLAARECSQVRWERTQAIVPCLRCCPKQRELSRDDEFSTPGIHRSGRNQPSPSDVAFRSTRNGLSYASASGSPFPRPLVTSCQLKFIICKDVGQVLSYVERGEVDAGLVYQSDANESKQVRIAATAPNSSHAPIVYPAAVIKASKKLEAATAKAWLPSGCYETGAIERR